MTIHTSPLIPGFNQASSTLDQRDATLAAFKDLFGMDLTIFPRHADRPNDIFFILGDTALWIPNITGRGTSSPLIHMAITNKNDINIQYPEKYFAIGYSENKKWSYAKDVDVISGLLQECDSVTLKQQLSGWLSEVPAFAESLGKASQVKSEITDSSALEVKVSSSNVSRERAKFCRMPL